MVYSLLWIYIINRSKRHGTHAQSTPERSNLAQDQVNKFQGLASSQRNFTGVLEFGFRVEGL